MNKLRLYDIDRAKGFAILLVVIGHLASPGGEPMIVGNDVYFFIKKIIYMFHMPFFMFLSGVIFYYTYKQIPSIKMYFEYIMKKIKKLFPAFMIFGSLIFIGKIGSAQLFYVDNFSYMGLFKEYMNLLVLPTQSFARSLWYIYVLLEFYILFPLLLIMFKRKLLPLVIIGIVLYFIPTTSYFALHQVFDYFIFFTLGIVIVRSYDLYTDIIQKYGAVFLLLFLLSLTSIYFLNEQNAKLLIGLLSIPSLHGLIYFPIFKNSHILYLLGKYTFVIYLMNTLFIGFTIGVLLKIVPLSGNSFYFFFPLLVFIGVIGPILTKKYFFSKISYLKKLTD